MSKNDFDRTSKSKNAKRRYRQKVKYLLSKGWREHPDNATSHYSTWRVFLDHVSYGWKRVSTGYRQQKQLENYVKYYVNKEEK